MARLTVDNPYNESTACDLELAEWSSVSMVLDRARMAAEQVRRMAVADRIEIVERAIRLMENRRNELAADISKMMGKPLAQARNEVGGMALRARYMMSITEASLADTHVNVESGFERIIRKEPLGVVLDLPAWNYPLLTAVNVVIPAFLAGNAVIVKHSPRSPLCGEHFSRAFRDAGASTGMVQHLHCDHPTSERIVGDPRVDHVVYTGSVFGGHRIVAAAANRFHHVGLELGGNDPAYVAPDCDFRKAVENIVDGAIYNAGQSCCAVERVYVHRSLYSKFVEACEPLVKAYVMGDPMDERTTLGPIAQANHIAELSAFVVDAKDKGARVIAGGNPAKVNGRGRFFEATLIADAGPMLELMNREVFGPILPIAPVDTDEEALTRMNASPLGLTASVWTGDVERARRMAKSLQFGTVFMNRCDHVDPSLPWSGWKDSGRGLSLSALGFDQLTRTKALHFRF